MTATALDKSVVEEAAVTWFEASGWRSRWRTKKTRQVSGAASRDEAEDTAHGLALAPIFPAFRLSFCDLPLGRPSTLTRPSSRRNVGLLERSSRQRGFLSTCAEGV